MARVGGSRSCWRPRCARATQCKSPLLAQRSRSGGGACAIRCAASAWRCKAAARTVRSPGACSMPAGRSAAQFEGLSGSSAGAMNAVVLANGWMKGGRDGARQGLGDFWTAVGKQMPVGMVTQGEGDAISLSPASKLLANWAGYFSPSQLNPFDLNPLRDLIASQVDFEQLRAASPFKLFIGATQANTGKLRVFRESELTAGHAAGLRLPAQDPPRGGDRRRAVLGRRLLGQSCGLPAVLRLRLERRVAGAAEPAAARRHAAHRRGDRGPHRRAGLQRPLHARDADVRACHRLCRARLS